jgi:hypothetical protein
MGGCKYIYWANFIIFILLFSFNVNAEEEPNKIDLVVIECPNNFEGYKEEYDISEVNFRELFEVCYNKGRDEEDLEDFKSGKMTQRYIDENRKIKFNKSIPSHLLNLGKRKIVEDEKNPAGLGDFINDENILPLKDFDELKEKVKDQINITKEIKNAETKPKNWIAQLKNMDKKLELSLITDPVKKGIAKLKNYMFKKYKNKF